MPLRELECVCGTHWDALIRNEQELDEEMCPSCGAQEFQLVLSSPGGYHITGNNGASQRPKSAGSWKK